MKSRIKDCLTIQVSKEEVNSPDFDLLNHIVKKFKKEWLKKSQEFEQAEYPLPFNNVDSTE